MKVVLYRHKGDIAAFRAAGHAGNSPQGENIACAAISAIVQSAVIGLAEHAKLAHSLDMHDGFLYFKLQNPQEASGEGARAITETMRLALESFQMGHPKLIQISEEVF